MSVGPRYLGDTELPWESGTHPGPTVRLDEANIDYGDNRWSLTGIAAEHVLFSAVTLVYAGLPKDPVAVYWSEQNLPDREAPLWVDVGRTVLLGLPQPYDQVLFACPRQYATGLVKFLDRLSLQRPDGWVAHSVRQRIPIVDWPLLRGVSVAPPRPPTVLVELYGVDAPDCVYSWRTPANPWTSPVQLKGRVKPKPKGDAKRRIKT